MEMRLVPGSSSYTCRHPWPMFWTGRVSAGTVASCNGEPVSHSSKDLGGSSNRALSLRYWRGVGGQKLLGVYANTCVPRILLTKSIVCNIGGSAISGATLSRERPSVIQH